MKKLKCFEPGFHNGPEDFDYLLWTWKDYALRWVIIALPLGLILGLCAAAKALGNH